ncbi:hypothetical protein DXG03_000942 [Asterophora parasitica]|uniref:DUF1917-domain-containing protein n=1 Tax=Asterophora parasitica TaxID=117018 RepID=A0A9P7G404_9AGAR|nr:hypothetical protein DXG03_000942 [Asterophora parasitica]
MVDDDYAMEDASPACKPTRAPISPPLPTDLVYDSSTTPPQALILRLWDAQTTKPADASAFFARWPPSRTPVEYANWIAVDRGPHAEGKAADLEGLMRDWAVLRERAEEERDLMDRVAQEERRLLSESQNRDQLGEAEPGELTEDSKRRPGPSLSVITVDTLDALALAHSVLSGKWLIYASPAQVDDLWARIVTAVVLHSPSSTGARAKVSPARPDEPHVICVYVEDYSDAEEVGKVREALRRAGVRWRIGFKPDIYTHVGIYKGNGWGVRPSRFLA